MIQDDPRLKKLKLRAWRRGFKEADLILGPFADRYAATFTSDQLDELERLLDQPDQDLYAWILERMPTPPEFDGEMMARLKAFRDEVHQAIKDG